MGGGGEGTLGRATDADVADVVGLMNRAYRGTGWTTESYIAGDRTTDALLRAEIAAKPDGSLLIWRDAGEGGLKGSVWVEPLGDGAWYLGSLAVDPDRQTGGLGNALLASAEQWIRARGGRRVQMTVVNVRDRLIAWYLRRGYALTGETEPWPYGDDRFGVPQRD